MEETTRWKKVQDRKIYKMGWNTGGENIQVEKLYKMREYKMGKYKPKK